MSRTLSRRPIRAGDESGLKPRRSPRVEVEEKAQLRSQNLYQVEVQIRNVSTCGFQADCGQAVQIGSYVSLDVPGIGPVQAQVRWQLGQSMGGMFLDPISLARCKWVATRPEPELERA